MSVTDTFGKDFDFNALGDKNSKWVTYYDAIKEGLVQPGFIIFPGFDTKYVGWFKKRKQLHGMLTEFIDNIDDIIEQKRKIVKENKNNKAEDGEKDLVTLMIESAEQGEGLSNEELHVVYKNTHLIHTIKLFIYRAICAFSFSRVMTPLQIR